MSDFLVDFLDIFRDFLIIQRREKTRYSRAPVLRGEKKGFLASPTKIQYRA